MTKRVLCISGNIGKKRVCLRAQQCQAFVAPAMLAITGRRIRKRTASSAQSAHEIIVCLPMQGRNYQKTELEKEIFFATPGT